MTVKKVKTLKALKNRLKKTLPEKISEVIASYEVFSEHPVPEDAKGFGAHHTACKAAVVHAETLLKLAKWTDDKEMAETKTNEDILEMIAQARNELSRDDDDD
ncbi:MAG: hypothetical protein J6A33_05380 [Alphaproteobacteria bacterium]|nr:hypothetical protein [Alphaproteobacteria bacterium]